MAEIRLPTLVSSMFNVSASLSLTLPKMEKRTPSVKTPEKATNDGPVNITSPSVAPSQVGIRAVGIRHLLKASFALKFSNAYLICFALQLQLSLSKNSDHERNMNPVLFFLRYCLYSPKKV